MKPQPPPLKVGTPCPKLWSELTGDDKRRYCDQCQLHVHNLSAMPAGERDRFVAESGGRLCIAYTQRVDGTMVTPSRWNWLGRIFRPVRWAVVSCLATALPFLFANCAARRTVGEALPPSKGKNPEQNCQVTMGVPAPFPENPGPGSKTH